MRALKHIEQLTLVKEIQTEDGIFQFRGLEFADGAVSVVCEDYSGNRLNYPLEELTEKNFIKEQ